MKEILLTTIKATGLQIIGILGVFFLFGYLLAFIQKRILNIYKKSIGWRGVLFTGWIGTPIHELGHLAFALIFNYKIKEVSLFKTNKKTGRLGHVRYGRIPHNICHEVGRFFVGSAPLIFGSLAILALLYLLVPSADSIFAPILNSNADISVLSQITETLTNLFSYSNLKNWKFWVFIYLSFSIVTHIAPSKRDQKQMWSGLLWLTLLLFAINFVALTIFNKNITNYILQVNDLLTVLTSTFILALLLSLSHYLIAKIIFFPFHK